MEPVASESPFATARKGGQIGQGGTKTPRTVDGAQVGTQNVKLLPNDCWCLEPFTDKPNSAHRDDTGPGPLRLTALTTSADMVEKPFYRKPTQTDIVVDPHVLAVGNYYLVRNMAAGGSWASSLSADLTADPMPTLPEGNEISISRKVVTQSSYPDSQAWNLETIVPRAQGPNYAQVIKTFYFWAKPSDASISGTYVSTGYFCVRFLYGGQAQVFQQIQNPSDNSVNIWSFMDEWAYSPPGQDPLRIRCSIWPVYDNQGVFGWLVFDLGSVRTAQSPIAPNLFTTLPTAPGGMAMHSHSTKYRLKPNATSSVITGPSKLDLPDNAKTPTQITPITYPLSGTLVDNPFNIPFNPTIASNIRLYWNATTFSQSDGTPVTTLDAKMYDNTTGDELMLVSSGTFFKEYVPTPRQSNYFIVFTFATTDATQTPFLWDWKVIRDAVYRDSTAAEIDIPTDFPQGNPGLPRVIVTSVNVSGPERDVTHETAAVTIEDFTGELPTLEHRVGHRTEIWTQYDPLDPTLGSVLFDGFNVRSPGDLKGRKNSVYPSEFWRSYSCTFTAMWKRLKQTLTSQIYLLAGVDDDGNPVSLKVSDFCRDLIATAGFPPEMIDIPDSDIIFDGLEGNPGIVDSLTPVLDIVTEFLENFLGWYLAWDANAGTRGMWRALIPPPAFLPYTNLCRFTLDPPASGRLAMRPESYGTTNWVTQGDGTIPTVPIIRRTFQPYVKEAEGTSVYVTSTGQLNTNSDGATRTANEWHNLNMYNFVVDGDGDLVITADPNHQDYTNGSFAPIYVVIFGLTQATVDILTRRIADVSLHALKILPFRCPLPLVFDPNDTMQTAPRPLRYYDPVLVRENGADAQFLVRSCSFSYRKDHMQFCNMELFSSLTGSG